MEHTVQAFYVGDDELGALNSSPFFELDQAEDYRTDHGYLHVYEAEVVVSTQSHQLSKVT